MKNKAKLRLIRGNDRKAYRLKQNNQDLALSRHKLEEINEELSQSLQKEKELNKMKLRYMSIAAHEFRSPLASILSSTELLKHYSNRLLEEEKQDLVKQVEIAARRMTELLDNVLIINKLESDKQQVQSAPLNLEDLCRNFISEIQVTVHSNHHIVFTYKGDGSPVVMDEKILRHIFNNLLNNAIKYSPNGERIEFSVSTQKGQTIFKVKDSGIGIPFAEQEKLFEPFHRASNVGKIDGTGLGLSIVKQMVDLHGGTITVDSEVGVGTTFIVSLPSNNWKHYGSSISD